MVNKIWGYSTSIDLKNCNPSKIRSALKIQEFSIALVKLLRMKAYGEPIIVHFGDSEDVKGYTLVQLIYTSSITAHFAEKDNSIYLDIFSCKNYDSEKAADFARKFFESDSYSMKRQDRI